MLIIKETTVTVEGKRYPTKSLLENSLEIDCRGKLESTRDLDGVPLFNRKHSYIALEK
jgi:hypothetical protein